MSRLLRFLSWLAGEFLDLIGRLIFADYEAGQTQAQTRELDRQEREADPKRRQADAERDMAAAKVEAAEAVKEREAITVKVPETDDEGEALAKRLGEKLK